MRLRTLLGAALLTVLATGTAGAQETLKFHRANPNSPLSNIVEVGNTIYLSGMLGTGGERGIQPETKAALENIKKALESVGASMDQVVKCTVFLADFAEWGKMNEVYVTYFPTNRPARSAVAVAGMANNARVEIECMAVRGARTAG